MSYECTYCNFHAPTNTRLKRHFLTQKHIRNVLSKQIHDESQNILNEIIEENVQEKEEEVVELCENMDCERYPPDWDFEEDTHETYEQGQWVKCGLCEGYFNDDGSGDILYVQEEPNYKEAECSLCGKSKDIIQMKGCGQYLCGNACDEEEEEEDNESNKEIVFDIEEEREVTIENILPNDSIIMNSVQEETLNKIEEKEPKIIFDIEEEREVTIENILPNNSIIMNSVQEDTKEVVKFDENIEYIENSLEENSLESEIIFIEIPILDIQTIEMLKDFNELVTTHVFLLNILSFIMSIVRFFAPNKAHYDPHSSV